MRQALQSNANTHSSVTLASSFPLWGRLSSSVNGRLRSALTPSSVPETTKPSGYVGMRSKEMRPAKTHRN